MRNAEPVPGVKPAVLKWARERAGYTVEQVARALNQDVSVVTGWESTQGSPPSYAQLEKLAYQLYKRPVALFFFPEPPIEKDPKQSFRTLPDADLDSLEADTRFAIRHAQALQMALRELHEGTNPSKRSISSTLQLSRRANPRQAASLIRKHLGVTLEQQLQWDSTEQALEAWRSLIEEAGVYVFKRSFSQNDISGFCLFDRQFPIIYLNNSSAKSRQCFSLFHELGHILFHINGIAKYGEEHFEQLPAGQKSIEVLCNRFASEVLIPGEDFEKQIPRSRPKEDSSIAALADRYKVSREAILRRFLDLQLITKAHYELKSAQWNKEYLDSKQRDKSGGGNYYLTQAAYLGDRYLSLVFGKYSRGQISIEQVADYFSVKTSSVPGLESVYMKRAPAT